MAKSLRIVTFVPFPAAELTENSSIKDCMMVKPMPERSSLSSVVKKGSSALSTSSMPAPSSEISICRRFLSVLQASVIQRGNNDYYTIKPDRIIPEWPEMIKNRLRIGDWEGDTVLGKSGCGVIVSQVDRNSRYLLARLCHTKKAEDIKDAIITMFEGMPVKSISFDNGSEFSKFREIEKALNAPIYFAEPHKPWQRGTNENTNGILRFFFPKGCDLLKVTQQDLDYVVSLINNRPRKCLGWKTPAEVFFQSPVALT